MKAFLELKLSTAPYRLFLSLSLLFLIITPNLHAQKQESDRIIGVWFNEEKTSGIEIYKSGKRFCGKIIWLKEPNRNGKAKLDEKNPEVKLRDRPIIGLNILTNFKYSGDSEWTVGKIYDPRNGETYSCILTLESQAKLEVRGYVGISLIGKSTTWIRTG